MSTAQLAPQRTDARITLELKHRTLHLVASPQLMEPLLRVMVHRTKLIKREQAPVLTYPSLPKQHRRPCFTSQPPPANHPSQSENHQSNYRTGDIQNSFSSDFQRILGNGCRGKKEASLA